MDYKKIDRMLRLVLVALALSVFLGYVDRIFDIPVDKPYYTGEWDEPFAINAGINVLRTKGDPVFYNYGGSTTYPHALIFHLYCKANGIVPYYKQMDVKYKRPIWPITRKIYPVKPVYMAKVVSYLLFLVGAFLVVGLISYLLLPVVFWLIPMVMPKSVTYMANQMLPETHLALLAGFTVTFFVKAILTREDNDKRYFMWVMLCVTCASLTVAVKINAAYIVLLPLSLLWRIIKEKTLDLKRSIFLIGGFALPYVLVNPALIFNFAAYKEWLLHLGKMSGTEAGIWVKRLKPINEVLQSMHLYWILPTALLIILFAWACILMVKKNLAAFTGFIFFFSYSFLTIINMKHNFYSRHLIYLIVPFALFILFPLIYYYQKASYRVKMSVSLICLLITVWVYSPAKSVTRIAGLSKKSFCTTWKKESRDELAEFVLKNNAKLYFYDFHNFSLPNNIHQQIIPFSHIDQIPGTLQQQEYVAIIKYKVTQKRDYMRGDRYNSDVERLMEKYKIVKTFGPKTGAHDINDQSPLRNPTIQLLTSRLLDPKGKEIR